MRVHILLDMQRTRYEVFQDLVLWLVCMRFNFSFISHEYRWAAIWWHSLWFSYMEIKENTELSRCPNSGAVNCCRFSYYSVPVFTVSTQFEYKWSGRFSLGMLFSIRRYNWGVFFSGRVFFGDHGAAGTSFYSEHQQLRQRWRLFNAAAAAGWSRRYLWVHFETVLLAISSNRVW